MDAKVSDLDEELINEYKKHIGAEEVLTEQILRTRGFMRESSGHEHLTNAAVLLFARNI